MSDVSDSETEPEKLESEPKKKKGKKRPSDFEIIRTILQRTHERKLSRWLKNMGEDSDIVFLCSCEEEGFTYGSPELAIAIIEFTDPDLKAMADTVLGKLHGICGTPDFSGFINIRDQISELVKTKGESLDTPVETNSYGSSWIVRRDVNGKETPVYYSQGIDSLYHVQLVADYCKNYRALLDGNDDNNLYIPYSHPKGPTGTIVHIPVAEGSNHPLAQYFPHGIRATMTRGLDVILDTCVVDFPYPVVDEEFVIFQDQSASCQVAHRIIAEGWRMILLRPNAVFFPTLTIPITDIRHQGL